MLTATGGDVGDDEGGAVGGDTGTGDELGGTGGNSGDIMRGDTGGTTGGGTGGNIGGKGAQAPRSTGPLLLITVVFRRPPTQKSSLNATIISTVEGPTRTSRFQDN